MKQSTMYKRGFSLAALLIGFAIFAGVGFFLYQGGLEQQEALQEEVSSPETETTNVSENKPLVEIGAEDEMLVTEDDGATNNANENSGVVEAKPLKEFFITGRNFTFSENTLRVKKGDFVRINFSSADGFHDLVIDEFGVRTKQISTGQSSSVDFGADTVGTFEYYCSVGKHRQMGMVGTLVVEE